MHYLAKSSSPGKLNGVCAGEFCRRGNSGPARQRPVSCARLKPGVRYFRTDSRLRNRWNDQ